MDDVTIAIATYGDQVWIDRAHRAIASAAPQAPWVHVHGDSLHGARNQALDEVATPWVIFLDADDELEPGFVQTLAAGSADLRAPAVRYVRPGAARVAPKVPRVVGHHHDCTAPCLREGNFMVVGTMARTQLLRDVGGWRDFDWSEDWDLWLRCYLAGASIETIPAAIYRAHVRRDSRNRAPSRAARERTHAAIVEANLA